LVGTLANFREPQSANSSSYNSVNTSYSSHFDQDGDETEVEDNYEEKRIDPKVERGVKHITKGVLMLNINAKAPG
jgi:hypothetical protein